MKFMMSKFYYEKGALRDYNDNIIKEFPYNIVLLKSDNCFVYNDDALEISQQIANLMGNCYLVQWNRIIKSTGEEKVMIFSMTIKDANDIKCVAEEKKDMNGKAYMLFNFSTNDDCFMAKLLS